MSMYRHTRKCISSTTDRQIMILTNANMISRNLEIFFAITQDYHGMCNCFHVNYHHILLVNLIGRVLVRWQRFRNNLKIMCHRSHKIFHKQTHIYTVCIHKQTHIYTVCVGVHKRWHSYTHINMCTQKIQKIFCGCQCVDLFILSWVMNKIEYGAKSNLLVS